jgi:hypothetical protein
MCSDCKRDLHGTVYCESCLAREMQAPAPGATAGPPAGPIPGLALGLGFIPGVGAIYNGQYAKGFVHIVIFAVLINIVGHPEAHGYEVLFSLMIPTFIFYMAFEAFHTARKRLLGEPVDEWSGLFSPSTETHSGPAVGMVGGARSGGAIVLIGIGVLILLSNLGYLHLSQILRWWPLLLIGVGVSMLVNRLGGDGPHPPQGGM